MRRQAARMGMHPRAGHGVGLQDLNGALPCTEELRRLPAMDDAGRVRVHVVDDLRQPREEVPLATWHVSRYLDLLGLP